MLNVCMENGFTLNFSRKPLCNHFFASKKVLVDYGYFQRVTRYRKNVSASFRKSTQEKNKIKRKILRKT